MSDIWILGFDWLIDLYEVCPRLTSPAQHGNVGSLEVSALCVVGEVEDEEDTQSTFQWRR